MPTLSRPILTVCVLALAAALPVAAQAPAAGPDRLFLSFFEDATVIDRQWWEGQVEYADWDNFDTTLVRGVVAINPRDNLEVGGRVGFGRSDSDLLPDGSGATDLDLYGKWYFGTQEGKAEYSAGVVATIPTGDDSVGLGLDAFGAGVFGAVRYPVKDATLTGNIGVRLNGDARVFGIDLDGEISPFLGFGYIRPITDEVSFIAETRLETERFEFGENDFRVLAGLNLRSFGQGQLRLAAGVGLDDGAPDVQVIVGYAHTF